VKYKDIEAYSFSPDGLRGITKSPVLWGHKQNSAWPIIYFLRPRSMAKEDFDEVMKHIDIRFKVNPEDTN
jgi:hypothetical protein